MIVIRVEFEDVDAVVADTLYGRMERLLYYTGEGGTLSIGHEEPETVAIPASDDKF